MKMNLQKIELVIIALLAGCIIALRTCRKESNTVPKTVTKTVTIPGDKVPYEVKVKVPVPVYREIASCDTIGKYQKIDTAKILACYFSRLMYRDTICDTSFLAIIQETISQNRIEKRQLWVQNLRAQQVIYQTIIRQQKAFFIGPQVTFFNKIGIGPSFMYINGKNSFGGNIDLVNRGVGITYLRQIK